MINEKVLAALKGLLPNENTFWLRACEVIRSHSRFGVICHARPEGDAIGSQQAMVLLLRALNKEATAFSPDPVPSPLKFLDTHNETLVLAEQRSVERLNECEVVVLVDLNTAAQLGKFSEIFQTGKFIKMSIDHHLTHKGFADVNVVDSSASATGELIYRLSVQLNVSVTEPMARSIYTAIMTDTGSFRFANTTPTAHLICAELLRSGVKPDKIYGELYENESWGRLRLRTMVMETIELACGGRVAVMLGTRRMLEESGALLEDTEDFVNIPMVLKQVQVSLFFFERPDGKVKVSLRSKGEVNVSAIADTFGGGGHLRAAGVVFDGKLDEAKGKILKAVESALGCKTTE